MSVLRFRSLAEAQVPEPGASVAPTVLAAFRHAHYGETLVL